MTASCGQSRAHGVATGTTEYATRAGSLPIRANYNAHKLCVLQEQVQCFKYLGVILSSDLSFSQLIECMYAPKGQKDSQRIVLRFYNNVNNGTLLQLYLSLVRPHLEYASTVWSPYKQKRIKHLEKFALHMATKSWDCGYQDLLSMADITSLESRRSLASLCMCSRLFMTYAFFSTKHDSTRSNLSQYTNRQLLLQQPFAHSNAYQHSFVLW